MMTPTEKLILSRIKECYGLKIEQSFWKNVINYILNAQNDKTPLKTHNSYDSLGIFPLRVQKIQDPVTHADTYVIFLRDQEWEPEDQGEVDENTSEWRVFVNFVEDFFREDDQPHYYSKNSPPMPISHSTSTKEKQESALPAIHVISSEGATSEETKDPNSSKKNTWSSSVENVLNRSSNKKDKTLKLSEDIRAIPGGRYGCAQFIKICGPEILKKLSIGRLTLFVQISINKGILRYQRTLLVKNNPNDSVMSALTEGNELNDSMNMVAVSDPGVEKKSKEIKLIKEALISILSENPEGVSLAQIPLHLRKTLDFPINFQQLGYPKLKNFLVTMSDLIKIESSGTNHSFAILKSPHLPTSILTKPSSHSSNQSPRIVSPQPAGGGAAAAGGTHNQQSGSATLNIVGQGTSSSSNINLNNLSGMSGGGGGNDLLPGMMTNTVLNQNKSNPTRNPMMSQQNQTPFFAMPTTSMGHSRSANGPNSGNMNGGNIYNSNNINNMNIMNNMNSKKTLIFKDQTFNPDHSNGMMPSQSSSTTSNSIMSTGGSMGDRLDNPPMKPNKKFNTLTPSSEAKNIRSGRKKVSTLEDYLNKVKGLIEQILKENCYGVSTQTLYKELCGKLGFDFDPKMFNCDNFENFLLNNADNLVDIEIKKRGQFIIYPKNFRFGPQSKMKKILYD